MTEKRFEMIITSADGSFYYLDKNTGEKITSTLELENKLNALHEENVELKDCLSTSKEEYLEIEHINNTYKELGFKGIIDYAKTKLQQYGIVKEVEKGLWCMVTGGWSDNEHWLHCLNHTVSIFKMKHYAGYICGGAYYYTEKPHGDVEMVLE